MPRGHTNASMDYARPHWRVFHFHSHLLISQDHHEIFLTACPGSTSLVTTSALFDRGTFRPPISFLEITRFTTSEPYARLSSPQGWWWTNRRTTTTPTVSQICSRRTVTDVLLVDGCKHDPATVRGRPVLSMSVILGQLVN
ncbi:hypothetical protein N7449_004891 [Penicillium cf. viridicatum]|uniref:Uncharacterized protein n=1 Tax=Penicillium cf. viridicatum TaxID=2972119 RepID=A0A9W9MK75_9EURO|nr:hypothetical protein N7449_004891 [Penicillium cf. viridicatum]